MLYSFICPTNFINNKFVGGQSDFNLALSHLIELNGTPNSYTDALIISSKPIYLDNGVFENGESESIDSLINKIHYLQKLGCEVKYVFSPDVLFDPLDTYDNFNKFKSKYNGITKIVPVIQGESIGDFQRLVRSLIEIHKVDMLALSYMACVRCFEKETGTDDVATNRIAAMKELDKMGYNGSVHLLGLGDSLFDIKSAMLFEEVSKFKEVTHDSSSAFMLGLNKKGYKADGTISGGKIKERVNFKLDEVSAEKLHKIINNINFIKEL